MLRQSPLLRALEKSRLAAEAAERQARAAAAERAALQRKFDDELDELRRRCEEEIEAIRHRARQRSYRSAFHLAAAIAATQCVPRAAKPQKRKRKEREDSGKAAITPRRKRSFANAAKAAGTPAFVQRLTRFFAAASDGAEAMHTDARYRDTFGSDSTAETASEASGPAAKNQRPSSLDL